MSALDLSSVAAAAAVDSPEQVLKNGEINQISQRVAVGVYQQEPLTKKYVFNANGKKDTHVRVVEKLNEILNFNTPELLKIRKLAMTTEAVKHRRKIAIEKGFRGTSIYNEAVRFGAQIALSSTINDFVKGVHDRQSELRSIYDFGSLMLEHGTVAPPVVGVSKNVVIANGADYQRIAAHYKIISQAKFVSTPVTFMDYFNFQDYEVDDPSKFNVPMTENEMSYWRNGVYDGWNAGSSQASMEIESSVNRLNRDYIGMVRYSMMLLANMVSKPVVSKNSRSTDISNNSMDVGKVTLNISNKMRFNGSDELWEVLPRLDKLERSSLINPTQKAS